MIAWILVLFCGVFGYIAINQTIKLQKLTKQFNDELTASETYTYNVYFFILNILIELSKELQEIDHKQIFEKDDDVGITFTAIREAIEQVRHELLKLSADAADEIQENPNVEKNVFHVGSGRRDHTIQPNRRPARKGSNIHEKDPPSVK